jgi:uncharacterized phage-associated protein
VVKTMPHYRKEPAVKITIPKLKAILLYFSNYTDTKFLGKVKLMKLFYFLDFMHLKKYGSPITFDTYIHLEHGPIPSTIKNLVDSATDDIDQSVLTDTISIERPEGTEMCRVLPKRDFTEKDAKLFSETELEILKKVCLLYGDKNTKFIEDASHKESPWNKTDLLDKIPYALACEDNNCVVPVEEITLMEKIFNE